MELHEHLFRHESGRLTAALTRLFGVHNLALAEDVVQDAFCGALEVWQIRGVPDNPAAWLMTAARNRALDVLRRERTARRFAPELGHLVETEWTLAAVVDEAFATDVVLDEQLRMMFSCCHPTLDEPVKVALILNILCGFGAPEIAAAFLISRAAAEKRITRGKKALAAATTLFQLTDRDSASRLSAVQRALYLLFSEGYHGAAAEQTVRADLCDEAIRLAALLRRHPTTDTPGTNALAALMCLDAARLPGRTSSSGELHALWEQDRSRWDRQLIADGVALLDRSAMGPELTPYHLEAAIAAVHAEAVRLEDTNWQAVVELYDRLMEVAPSPVVGLNRAIAIAQRDGPAEGIAALESLADRDRLARYPFYEAALGELELRRGARARAHDHFAAAAGVARNDSERRFLMRRMQECGTA